MEKQVIHTIGRRKTSVARIYLTSGSGNITVNKKNLEDYFSKDILRYKVRQPMLMLSQQEDEEIIVLEEGIESVNPPAMKFVADEYDIKINVQGGGLTGQAEAIRLAVSRALVQLDAENRKVLKPKGLLTRDSRRVERKKPGRKKARKRDQFSKR
jgi:small subunit ribosomal protein S9